MGQDPSKVDYRLVSLPHLEPVDYPTFSHQPHLLDCYGKRNFQAEAWWRPQVSGDHRIDSCYHFC